MSRSRAVMLGFFTAWPFLYMVLFMCSVFGIIIAGILDESRFTEPPFFFILIIPLHFLTILEVIVLMVIYIIHIFRTDQVENDKKALWAVVIFLGNIFAMPVYWYLYVWKNCRPGASDTR